MEMERNGHWGEEGCDRACEQAASRGTESVLEANGEGIPQVFFAEIPMTHQYRATIAVGRDGATKKNRKKTYEIFLGSQAPSALETIQGNLALFTALLQGCHMWSCSLQ